MSLPIAPSRDDFLAAAAHTRVISVHATLVADDLNPVALYHRLCGKRQGTFLLESAESGVWSRYSFIGVNTVATLTGKGDEAQWTGRPLAGLPTQGEALTVLRDTLAALHTEPQPGLPPFVSGLVGYLGYDVVRRLERLPDETVDDLQIPDVVMLLVADMAVYDHHTGDLTLVANAINFDGSPERAEEAYADAVARVEAMAEVLGRPAPPLVAVPADVEPGRVDEQRTREDYAAAIEHAVAEIHRGEAFQVVVSQRFDVPTSADAFDVYRVLRRTNPSPYLYLLRLDGFDIVGSSPEALVTVTDGRATTHPIAGTRWRGKDEADDLALEADLLADDKERAEHLMLVDLGRNDLGRVCVPGTVEVVEFMTVRRYSHVMHLESTVTGRVAEGRGPLDVTLACFPAGTLSGAPKVRAMEIIEHVEPTRRGLYGGVVGYFDLAGNSDMAIAIRTALIKDGIAHVQAGGGIVADSTAAAEDTESRNKAAAAIRAVQVAAGLRPLSPRRTQR